MPEKCLQSNGRIMTNMKEKNAYEKIYDVPWYRVVTKEGRLFSKKDGSGCNIQATLLEKEGVKLAVGKVDMEQFQWRKRLL